MARADEPAARPAPRKPRAHVATPPAASAAATADELVPPAMRIAAAWSWRILVVAAVVALVGFVIVQLRLVAIPFFVALLLAALLVPFSNWLQRHGWPKWLAVAVNELAVIAVVAGLITVVVIQVRSGFPDLQKQTLAKYEELKDFLLASPLHLTETDIENYFDGLVTSISEDTSALVEQGFDLASLGGHILAGTLLALFVTLFILIDGRGIWNWVVKVFPMRARPAIIGAGEAGWLTLSTFVRVQIFVAAIDAVGIGLGAFILGLFYGGFPLVIPIAIAVFLASFIPVVGAVVSGGLAVFVALVYLGPVPALIMLGIVILVQQLEGHVLQPLLVGAAVKVHPVAVVLAVATGGFVAGIPGALFAVPLVAVLNVMIGYIGRGEWRTNPHPSVADVTSPIVVPRRRREG
ncbi:AI-2E family transporter [Pseudolysinimonas yzui]|nr:AI-2E family transporter [Pseudolysinimonas yzui]